MDKTVIETVTIINGYMLMVFYTRAHSWQFRILSKEGAVYGEKKTYYSARAAEATGRKWLEQLG
ncbi:hypothetical protein NIES4071_105870 (plasmid) [Calothrix sp. NIES-4071]|nr:hypothetical protein NIES4071_105870 [Calothrix sp. NIES-4071]BAZ65005.1 hypothetical protein NIES4105_107380 [Calothrix sp. NIES-4105]